MDFNDGRPVWHASAAALDMNNRRTLTIAEISESTKRVLVKTAKLLLGGVGQLPSSVEQMQLAIHYRRALTDAEYSRLSPQWCSIPAVHAAGHGLILEEGD
jgi:hypothetical protein